MCVCVCVCMLCCVCMCGCGCMCLCVCVCVCDDDDDDALVAGCRLKVRAHSVFWNKEDHNPQWLPNLTNSRLEEQLYKRLVYIMGPGKNSPGTVLISPFHPSIRARVHASIDRSIYLFHLFIYTSLENWTF